MSLISIRAFLFDEVSCQDAMILDFMPVDVYPSARQAIGKSAVDPWGAPRRRLAGDRQSHQHRSVANGQVVAKPPVDIGQRGAVEKIPAPPLRLSRWLRRGRRRNLLAGRLDLVTSGRASRHGARVWQQRSGVSSKFGRSIAMIEN